MVYWEGIYTVCTYTSTVIILMNTKDSTTLVLLFICTALLAGSCVLNILQFQQAQNAPIKKVQVSLLNKVPDIQRTGIVAENNPDERWLLVSYTDETGHSERLRAWVVAATSIQRTHTITLSGVAENASVENINQKDLHVGETAYIIVVNSADRTRLEVSRITVGDLLPFSP